RLVGSAKAATEGKDLRGEFFLLRGEKMRGNFAQIPHESAPGKRFERVVGNINFPPEKALARAGHVVVMIVVPAFAEGHQGEQPVVPAGVRRLVAARTEKMRKRIDGEGIVPEQRRAQAKAPEKERESANEKERYGENRRRNKMIFVQPAQLRKSGEITDVVKTRVVVFFGNNPADVRPEKSEERGR